MADEALGASLAAKLTPEEWQRARLASMQPERSPTHVVVEGRLTASVRERLIDEGLEHLAIIGAFRARGLCHVDTDNLFPGSTQKNVPA